jgi:hypothetical protein
LAGSEQLAFHPQLVTVMANKNRIELPKLLRRGLTGSLDLNTALFARATMSVSDSFG